MARKKGGNQYPNQYPPPVMVRDTNSGSFGGSLVQGFGIGAGAAVGSELTSSLLDGLFG